jgi:hypothetical protein
MADEDLRTQIRQVHEHVMKMGDKLDVITDIMLSIARTEERLTGMAEHNNRQDKEISETKAEIAKVRATLDGPNGVHAKVAGLVTKMGIAILVGVYVINLYFTSTQGH